MTDAQRYEVQQAARKLYQDRRITLAMATWAMKNAGYIREETAEWLGLNKEEKNDDGATKICTGKDSGSARLYRQHPFPEGQVPSFQSRQVPGATA
jgi:hypothetical protein